MVYQGVRWKTRNNSFPNSVITHKMTGDKPLLLAGNDERDAPLRCVRIFYSFTKKQQRFSSFESSLRMTSDIKIEI